MPVLNFSHFLLESKWNYTIQAPEEETTTTEESIYDLDYIVKRPSEDDDNDDDDSEEEDCDFSAGIAAEGIQKECKGAGRTPYTQYKGYKKWTRKPLLVIIIGGWDWISNINLDF